MILTGDSMISIKNLNYSYGNKRIFNNLNLDINQGDFVFVIGKNNCGKTTLIKILSGIIKGDFDIKINNKKINSINEIIKETNILLENTNYFVTDTVEEELSLKLRNLKLSEKEIEKEIKKISEKFLIDNILKFNPNNLSGGEKQLVKILATLIGNPKLIILDESTSMLDGGTKEKIYKYLKKLNRQNKTTIICTTNDMDNLVYGKRIIMLGNENIVMNEKITKEKKKKKIFKENDLELPFMASLSLKLHYYNLIDEIILDINKMVNKLWK